MEEINRVPAIALTGISPKGVGGHAFRSLVEGARTRVVGTYFSDEAGALKLVEECRVSSGPEVQVLPLDIRRYEGIVEFANKLRDLDFRPDVLVHNGAVLVEKPEREQSYQEKRNQTMTNFMGPRILTEWFLADPGFWRYLRRVVVVLSDLCVKEPLPEFEFYARTKRNLRAWAGELARRYQHLTVDKIFYGPVNTPMHKGGGMDPAIAGRILALAAQGELDEFYNEQRELFVWELPESYLC
jgi:short-subunit dehydrogenase